MESSELAQENPNEEDSSNSNDPLGHHPESVREESSSSSKCSEKVPSGDVKVKREIATKSKRVSFHFGTRSSDSKNVVLSTIQNIYDSTTATTNEVSDANLVRNNSTKNRINKSAYIKLHRHSFSSASNSSVDKLKGRYENIAKQTDNNLKANTVVRAKANTDNNSTNNAKNSDESDIQIRGEQEEENTQKSKSESLKAEFIHARPQSLDSAISSITTAKSSENLLLKTTSNIEKLQNNLSTKLSNDTIEKLRSKYSPASFGYPRDTKLPKKVQFAEEQSTRIPVPTPRISIKTQVSEELKKEEVKSNLATLSEDPKLDLDEPSNLATLSEDPKLDLDEPSKTEEIKTVTVKLVSVPDTFEQTTIEQTKIEQSLEETKDENSNLVVTNETITNVGKSKPVPPVVPSKPISPVVPSKPISPLVLSKQLPPLVPSKPLPPLVPSKPQQLLEEVPPPNIVKDNPQLKEDEIEEVTGIELEVTYDNIAFAEPEDKHFIVRRSSSEDSIDKVESFFSEIVMDKKPKEKKRSNSFRKILGGGFFGRDKKKSDEDKTKHKKKDNAISADNAQNESQAFDRNSSHRHTIDNSFPRREAQRKNTFQPNSSSGTGPLYYYSPQTQLRKTSEDPSLRNRYTEMKGNNFASNNRSKYSPEEYVPMDNGNLSKLEAPQGSYMNVSKYIDTSSSSSNTLESENRNCTYQNALIAQAEMRQIRENENIQRNTQRSGIPVNINRKNSPGFHENRFFKHSDSPEMFRESPPRSQVSSQNLQLVKPKALIPINSERPLPNPYRNNQDKTDGNYENLENSKTLDRNLNVDNSKPYPHKNNLYGRSVAAPDKTTNRPVVVEDVYGTVFDSISPTQTNLEYLRNRRPQSPPPRNVQYSGNQSSQNTRGLEYTNTQVLRPQSQSPVPTNAEYLRTRNPQSPPPRHFDHSRPQAPQSPVQTNSDYLKTRNLRSPPPRSLEYSETRPTQISIQTSLEYSRTRSPQSPTQSSLEYLRTRSLSPQHSQRSGSNCSSPTGRNPTSPRSLEASKLKLPSNREKVELQPRIRSPIPQAKISTDKIIATELLRNKRSPTRSSPVQEKQTTTQHVSPNRPASYQGTSNIYENNLSSPDYRRVTSPNAHSTPQSVVERRHNADYIYLNSPVLRNKPPPSPREASVAECLQAADWQRQQRELAKSPALENPQQITTNVMVHVNPEEERYGVRNSYASLPPNLGQRSPVNQAQPYLRQGQLPSPRSLNSSLNNVRSQTPIQQAPPSPDSKSPEKQHMLHNVEAFYWRELRKLKDKEEQDLLKYRQQQLYVYGYVEDPVLTRRSRSVSPSMHRGRRSLSLPRDVRPTPTGRGQLLGPEAIPEGRPVIAKKPITLPTESTYGQVRQPLQRNPNFIRNTFERSTIGPIGVNQNAKLLYENYPPNANGSRGPKQGYNPIFKRGSLTGNVQVFDPQLQGSKKVSFLSTQSASNPTSWPTKNGFTKSPPTRRIEREVSMDDDVFLPNMPRTPQNRKMEENYVRNSTEVDSKPIQKQQQMYQNSMGREMVYSSRPPRGEVEYVERRFQEGPRENVETLYGRTGPKQVTVSNKVCDIYGQIHEPGRKTQNSGVSQNYGQIRQMGFVYGQIQPSPNPNPNKGSPVVLRQSYNHLHSPPSNFVRGTRLTASVNDMYKRYPVENPRYEIDPRYQTSAIYSSEGPQRPLPPVPERKDSRGVSTRKTARGYVPISDTESGSEAGEVQRILQSGTRQKNFSVIEEEWNSDGKSGRASGNESGGSRGENEGEIKSGRSRSARREDPRRHTLSGDQHYTMAGQGGPLSRTMDLERAQSLEDLYHYRFTSSIQFRETAENLARGQFPRGYPPSSNAMLFDDDPGIMSEVETSSTGFRRGGKQRSSLPVVRTPSKTLERPLGLVFLQYRNETKRALLPNEITSIDTVKALFVRSFPKQLSMEYLDSPLVKIYIHDSSKDMFYELEDVRSHLREIRDRSVLRLFESTDVSGGLPMGGVGIPGGIGHFEDPSYFSEPEFDSEYQHQHIHKSKGSAGKGAPYYMGSTTSLPRGGPLLRPYSPAVGTLPQDRIKTLPAGAPPKPQRAYSSAATRASDGSSRPPDRFAPFQRPANPLFNLPDGYMSSPERGSRGYEDPYYSQYTSRSGSITPVIDEEVSDTELLDEQYSLYGVKLAPGAGPRGVRSQFPGPAAPPYDTTRLRVEHMERQLANLTGLVQKALTQTPTPRDFLAPPGRDAYRSGDEFDKNSSSSSASLPDDSYLRSDSNKAPKLGKTSCHKSVSFEKSVSFSDEPPDMNSPKQHSPQHAADTKPPKPAIKSSTLPRTSSQEKDRLKPAPPPKPASLSPGQYDGRHIYRDLQLTPEMYNQLRGLQKKAKDLRAEVRNLRRMSQAQAHSVRETIRDTFIKIRAMLMAGGDQVWQAGMDQERVRLSRDEDLYKQEMLRLEKDLTDLEASVEELRGNVINRKTRVNMSDVENMALVLSKSSKTVADLKLRFPGLQDSMKSFLSSEMDKVVREEKFLKEEPERLESALRRCKKLTGTLVTLKRLASVQEQRLPCSTGAADGRISPTISETPPVTPTSAQHSKPPSGARVGQVSFGGDSANTSDSNQRPENALDALLDELQTFSKPHPATVNTQMPQASYSDSTPSDPPAIPVKGIPPSHSAHFGYPPISEIGRKGSMDSASILPTQNLTVSTATGSLRRLHSYPSGSDTDNSPPIQPLRTQMDGKAFSKPPIPERNAELLQHIASGRRVPPPPPPRTSSKSPLASPTSPSLPPRSPATGLQHIQNVQNMTEKPQSQFEAATQNLGLGTLRRNVPNRSSLKDNNKAQTLPRNIGSNLQIHTQTTTSGGELQNVSSSSCESVNSQDGTKKGSRKEELEQRHQELLKKQKALQEQYARLQQLQRGNNTLAVVPPAPDQLLKKTGSESNLLQKMGLQMATAQMTGSLTHLPSTTTTSTNTGTNVTNTATSTNPPQPPSTTTTDTNTTDNSSSSSTTTTSKVYETDIL